jgi:hypothetical protein
VIRVNSEKRETERRRNGEKLAIVFDDRWANDWFTPLEIMPRWNF